MATKDKNKKSKSMKKSDMKRTRGGFVATASSRTPGKGLTQNHNETFIE